MSRIRNKIRLLVLHGPNLNLLGEREPEIYGKLTLLQLNSKLRKYVQGDCLLRIEQSNCEGRMIDKIHKERKWAQAIIINAGAWTHYSYAIRDALTAVALPTIEVHLSDIQSREEFRKISVIREVCIAQFYGKGILSYFAALDHLKSETLFKKLKR